MEFFVFSSFSIVLLFSACMVILAHNPVQSVFFLILCFCNASGLLLLLNVDFIALLFVIVYVGAVAVLFLFVVMMLVPKTKKVSVFYFNLNLPIGLLLAFVFVLELVFVYINLFSQKETISSILYTDYIDSLYVKTQLELLGQVLYNYFFFEFILAGLVLLVAMLGAIILSLHKTSKFKRQVVSEQLSRKVSHAIFFYKI